MFEMDLEDEAETHAEDGISAASPDDIEASAGCPDHARVLGFRV